MSRKNKGLPTSIPPYVSVRDDDFWRKMRGVVREEIKALSSPSGKVQVDGLLHMPLYDMDDVRLLFRNVSRTTIYEWIDQGFLKPLKLSKSGKVYFLWADIEKLFESRENGSIDRPEVAG